MSTMRQNIAAIAARVTDATGEPITAAQVRNIIAALAVDEDLRVMFNFAVMRARAHTIPESFDTLDSDEPDSQPVAPPGRASS